MSDKKQITKMILYDMAYHWIVGFKCATDPKSPHSLKKAPQDQKTFCCLIHIAFKAECNVKRDAFFVFTSTCTMYK